MYKFAIFLCFSCFGLAIVAQQSFDEDRPIDYGLSFEYPFEAVVFEDFGETEDGYYLFTPEAPGDYELGIVVFMHGYGAYNPMVYGEWIAHIAKQGNVVIFPRYQKNLLSPGTDKFVGNAVTGIKAALAKIKDRELNASEETMSYVGHSYGGVINTHIVARYDALEMPCPAALMCCSPGTGPFKGGLLEDYSMLHEDLKLLLMVSENDYVVGDKFARRVFAEATNVADRNYIIQYTDENEAGEVGAGHNESYALNMDFDSGERNITTRRGLRIARTDFVDYAGYWKLFDALLDCAREGKNCQYALGNTKEQRFMGVWPNGTPVRELEVFIPEREDDLSGQ